MHDHFDGQRPVYPVKTNLRGAHWHDPTGHGDDGDGNHEDDLVSLVSEPIPEPAPSPSIASASPASHLPPAIANGDVPFYVVVAANPNGEKLVWETPIPEETTLEAALKRRLRLNLRYSVCCIAECRIIPALTVSPIYDYPS